MIPCFEISVVLVSICITSLAQQDSVHGNPIQFNDNGALFWYQDERTVINRINGNLMIGSVTIGSYKQTKKCYSLNRGM